MNGIDLSRLCSLTPLLFNSLYYCVEICLDMLFCCVEMTYHYSYYWNSFELAGRGKTFFDVGDFGICLPG